MSTLIDGPPVKAAQSEAPAKDAFSAHAADRTIGGLSEIGSAGLGPQGRKACAVMKVVSSVMLAVAVYPGGDANAAEINEATRTVLARALELAEAVLPWLDGKAEGERGPVMRNQLRQYAADTVSLGWRLSHSTGYKDLSASQIMQIYQQVDESNFVDESGAEADDVSVMDLVAAKRIALVSVMTEVHNAVGNFDYFAPDPDKLVESGVRTVIGASEMALSRLLPDGLHDERTRTVFTHAFIERAGLLYAQNFRAVARKDVKKLTAMEDTERARFIHENKTTGLSTSHIDDAYHALMERMVSLILEAAPDISADQQPGANPGNLALGE